MLTFFRRIRKGLLGTGATSKYLLYAVGEIALVVIGILIALQINNWNEWRKDRDTEEQVLENLAKNLELNIDHIYNRLGAISRRNRSGDIIFSVVMDKLNNSDTLWNHWHGALLNHANLTLSEAGYESLKNVGFDIVSNASLKEEIINLYEDTYLNLGRRQTWGNRIRPDWDSFIMEHFINVGAGKGGLIPRDFDFIVNDNYFYGLIDVARGQRSYYGRHFDECLEETQRVLQLIKDELEN